MFRILECGLLTVVLGLGSRADHLARTEDQCRGLWLADAHDGGRESLGLVFDIATIQTDIIQIKLRIQVSS